MWSTVHARDVVAAWDVASPERPSRVAGVTMAGFGVHSITAPLRMVPHPGLTLVLEFGAGQPIVDDVAGPRPWGSLVAGLGFGFGGAVLVRGENVECVQVRLSPAIARAVLGVSPADLDGAVVSLDDLWGREAARIRERLGEVSSWEERFALTDALLARRNEAASAIDAEVSWAWHRILAGRGLVRIDALATELGWSRKRLWSRFRSQLGMQPKLAAKLVRFDHAVHRLVAGEGAARVAADGGYADQSHLHRDVVAFTGVTPGTVVDEPFLAVDDTAWPTRAAR
ncbi:helix-turn-helix domain-containing protein [Actinopolymorpha pittospori]|uniref:AraC-like DNA-binding protein n=1 Tax=Actinopolymorpha pittospori TaxID=648752 RepID=A0A927N2J4_9ACTN|nr:AraC-like DNA-binding protein [Actinopolymorpha pittospori]